MPKKNLYDVKQLKENWRSDPMWNIEDTEGFEEFRLELKQYRLVMESNWALEESKRLLRRATQLACSVDLVKYIEVMEYRMGRMETKVLA